MTFLAPLLLAGAALAAAPVIIHLLNRRKPRRIPWAAMAFLVAATAITRRRLRIEDILLMIVRALIVALVALALARPVLNAAGPSRGAEAVILVDKSASMRFAEGAGTLFDFAKSRVYEILSGLGAGGRAVVVTFDSSADYPGGVEPAVDAGEIRTALEGVTPGWGGTDYTSALSAALRVSRGFPTRAPAVFVVSDFRDTELPSPNLSSRLNGGVYLVPVTEADGADMGVTSATGAGAAFTTAADLVSVRVTNSMPQKAVAGVSLSVDGGAPEDTPVSVAAGAAVSAIVRAEALAVPGVHRLEATLPPDAYDADNHAWGIVARRALRLEVSASADAAVFVNAALDAAPAGSFDVTGSATGGVDGYIFASAPPAGAAADALWKRVRAGAFAVVFLDRANAAAARDFLSRSGIDALAAQTLAPVEAAGTPFSPAAEGEHAVTKFLQSSPDLSLSNVRATSALDFAPAGEGIVTPLTVATPAGKKAYLAIVHAGDGGVAFFNAPATRDAGNFPASPFFVPLLYETLGALAGDPSAGLNVSCGQPAALPAATAAGSAEVAGPEGSVTATREVVGGRLVLAFTPQAPGFYAAGGATLAANVPESEAVMRTADRAALERAFSGKVISGGGDLSGVIEQAAKGREISPTLLALAAALLGVEMLLVYFFKRSQ